MKILLFSDEKCGSCRKWLPIIHEIADELNIPLELYDNKEMRLKYQIKGLPTTILLDDEGNEIYSILGNIRKDKGIESLRYYIDGGKRNRL